MRMAVACSAAACGMAAAQDVAPPAGAPSPAADLSTMYRDAYLSPNGCAPRAALDPANKMLQGEWRNQKRWRLYGGADYLRMYRGPLRDLALTTTSRNLFADDDDQISLGALNADVPNSGSREGDTQVTQIFPARVFPDIALTGILYTPNDEDARSGVPVGTVLTPGESRMNSNQFDINGALSGVRPKIGIEFPNGNRVEFSYFQLQDLRPGQLVDNVAGSAFLTKTISSGQQVVFFAMQRWGYLNAPFTVGTSPPPGRTEEFLQEFRGEDVRAFRPNGLFPHFPYNEVPQPTAFPGPASPANPLVPLFPTPDGMRSSDIPREPTQNDFPDNGSFLFQDGELAIANFRSDLSGFDLTYRHRVCEDSLPNMHLELTGGLRVLNMNERFTFFFADLFGFSRTTQDTATPNIPQPPFFVPNDTAADPVDARAQAAEQTQMTIDRKITNCMFGPEVGVAARFPFWSYFEWNVNGKLGWTFNALKTSQLSFLQTGLVFNDYSKDSLLTSGIFEGQLGLNFYPHPNVKLNIGYEWLLMMRVGTALGNLSFDMARENRPNNKDDVLYNGMFVGGEVTW
ncbi:MAG TPA: hypothetical protein VNC50_12990 [Planctomycetia bacterium]|nr:hypothetical protein [Planctomycetia bacterium]